MSFHDCEVLLGEDALVVGLDVVDAPGLHNLACLLHMVCQEYCLIALGAVYSVSEDCPVEPGGIVYRNRSIECNVVGVDCNVA